MARKKAAEAEAKQDAAEAAQAAQGPAEEATAPVVVVGLPSERKKILQKIFKGLAEFTSDDKSRPHLAHVYAPSQGVLEATDGHMAVRLTLHNLTGHGLEPGFYLPSMVLAQLQAEVVPTPARLDGYSWPPLDPCIPKVPQPADELLVEKIHLGAKLVARVMDGIALMLAPWNSDPTVQCWTATDALSPVRFDAGEPYVVTVTAVLMPRHF